MDYEILENIKYLRLLHEQKLLLYMFYEELLTGKEPQELEYNPILSYKYYRFKREYLLELATSYALEQQIYYQNELLAYMPNLKVA